jgi:hypothetical protein
MLEEDLYLPGRLRESNPASPSSSTATLDSFSSVSDSGTSLTTPISNHHGPSASMPQINLLHSKLTFPHNFAAPDSHVSSAYPPQARRPSMPGSKNKSESHFNLQSLISRIPALPELPPPPPPKYKGKSRDNLSSAGPGVSSAAFAYPAFGASLGFSSRTPQKARSTRPPKRPSTAGEGQSPTSPKYSTGRKLSLRSSRSEDTSSEVVIKPVKSGRMSTSSLPSTEVAISRNAKGKERESLYDQNSEETGQTSRSSHIADGRSIVYSHGRLDSPLERGTQSVLASVDAIVRKRSVMKYFAP